MAAQVSGRSVTIGSPEFLTGFASWIDGGDDLLVQVFPDWRDHRWPGRMDLASRKFGDEISGRSVGDLNHVEAQLFGGSSRLVGLGMREPGCVGPPISVEAEHDDFVCCGQNLAWYLTSGS